MSGDIMRCVLVANRGEIARRIFRSAAARGMRTVAVYSDADAQAPYVNEADLAVRLPGRAPAETYLRGDLVIAAAHQAGADCIHPGYGFLSENAEFARAVERARMGWIGPPAAAIDAMGSKLTAKAMMAAAGVPTSPSADVTGLDGEALGDAAETVGFPLLVKAAFGGGGRGMRVVLDRADVATAVQSAAGEAKVAFGDGTVFLERLVRPARHVEVQIFGDAFGTVVALHERECSIQRRHQKVVEESPSPAVDAQLRSQLCEAAVRAGEAIGYVGAGTVEFLLAADGAFYFLEVNTRLQVEHPVTEAVTGLDLVDLQFAIAAGERLPPHLQTPPLEGSAIEVRLYAEDPQRDWLPQAGRLDGYAIPHIATFGGIGLQTGGVAVRGVRLDSGVEAGSTIAVAYDAMLAKVISWAPDRRMASALLAGALRQAEVSGVATNRDLLVRVLESDAWLAGETDTGFLAGPDLAALAAPLVDARCQPDYALAAALGHAALRRRDAHVLRGLPSGWRNNPSVPQEVSYTRDGIQEPIVLRYLASRDGVTATLDGIAVAASVMCADAVATDRARVVLDVGGVRRSYEIQVVSEQVPAAGGSTARVHVRGVDGSLSLGEVPRFREPSAEVAPGSLVAAMPGTVLRLLAAEGDTVQSGQPIVVLEAMKMEHTIAVPAAGTLTSVAVAVGAQVETGSLLAVIEPAEEPSS
jgi:propionyl-CoA carboxylase alpha chain